MTEENQTFSPDPVLEKRHTFREEAWETVRFILIALAVVIPIRLYIAQPFIVSGASMDPTFESGQYLIVDEMSYHLSDPVRGDVIIFRFPQNPKQHFIKRVIGLPGETVSVDSSGTVTVKNILDETIVMNEPYVKFTKADNMKLTLKKNEYFVMGDNRAGSYDSRAWGPVPRENIVGRALVRLFPPNEIAVLPGEFRQ